MMKGKLEKRVNTNKILIEVCCLSDVITVTSFIVTRNHKNF